ncbi:MAG: YfhO family protein [Ignavibacteria bacterium]
MAKIKTQSFKSQPKKVQGFKAEEISKLFYTDSLQARYTMLTLVVLFVLIFFSKGIFGGKVFAQPDNLSPLSFRTYLNDAKAAGIFPLWLPYIFLGMPSLASLTTALLSVHNIYSYILDSLLSAFAGDNLFLLTVPYYFIFAISLFFYARYKFKNNIIATYAALVGTFATGIIQLIIVGHHTKMMTFAFFPLILYLIDRLLESKETNLPTTIVNFAILTIVLYIQLHFHHIQMLLYSYMMIGIYLMGTLVYQLFKKTEIKPVIRALLLTGSAVIIAVAMDADIILSVKEYNQYSMRGQSSIESQTNPVKSDNKPLSYEYATSWSFSPGEILTFVFPYYYGFGTVDVQGQRANLYWGQMPFTDAPVYFGVITLLLAIIGVALDFKKNPFVQILTFITLFFLLLSFGYTFPIVYNFFYYNVPYFSSFRAPVMIHYYMDFAILLLACVGLKGIIDSFKDNEISHRFKKLSLGLIIVSTLLFLVAVVGFESSYKDSVLTGPLARQLQGQGVDQKYISQFFSQYKPINIIYDNFISNARFQAFILLLISVLIYLLTQRKFVTKNLIVMGIGMIIVVGIFDQLNITTRTIHWDDKKQKESYFEESDYIKWILNKEPETYNYRVADLNENGLLETSNFLAYFRFHLINGYQGAKLRIYQDCIDIAGGNNPFFFGLANVKYVVSPKFLKDTLYFEELYKGKNIVYRNKFWMPRAFFVQSYSVENGINILHKIKDAAFDPYKVVFLEKPLPINIDKVDTMSYAKISYFDIHNIKYDVRASGNNMLVLNEIYYPAGWKAYIDGQETEIYKANYFQRAVIVPPGKHTVEMRFYPETYYKGKKISIAANIFVSILLIIGIAFNMYKRKTI